MLNLLNFIGVIHMVHYSIWKFFAVDTPYKYLKFKKKL